MQQQRRLISALLLVCFSLLFAGPVFAVYAQQPGKMACCKSGRGACCHTKRRTESGWTAVNDCPQRCGMPAVSLLAADSLLPSASSHAAELVWHPVAPAFGQVYARASFYLAFLYQLPPPVSSL